MRRILCCVLMGLAPVLARAEPAFFRGMVEAHNALRLPLGLPAMSWSTLAARQAQGWANQLAAQGCPARYNPDPLRRERYGENVLRAFAPTEYQGVLRTPEQVVARWAADGRDYDPATQTCRNPGGTRCGQYLAIIDPGAEALGCGYARCPDAEVWVCNYAPRGGLVAPAR